MKKLILKIKGWLNTFLKYKDLLILLVQRDLKLKYRRSFLGYLWSILNPLLSMAVQAIVFTTIFRHSIDNYPVYLICGNILFSFMRDSSQQALTSVVDNAALLKKTYVPKYIFTLSKITSGLVNFVFSLGALLIVMIATGVPFRWQNLLSVVPIVELYVFCIGLGLFVAALTVFFRDMKNLWSVVTLAWMYMTPIFYPVSIIPQRFLTVYKMNPMYQYITFMRTILIEGKAPTPMNYLGCIVSAVILLIIGRYVFKKNEDKFILYL